jgi:hypothetical protein
MDDETKSLIGASIRTLLVGMPSIPAGPNPFAVVAQAWSEFEGHKFKQRVEEFITAIHARLTSLESLQQDHLGRVLDLENQAALLEEAVAAASREPAVGKRQAFAEFYVAAITGKLGSEPDSIRSLLQTLESLTLPDIKILQKFEADGWSSGDLLTETVNLMALKPPFLGASHSQQEVLLTPFKLSILKLENRGLVRTAPRTKGGGADVRWLELTTGSIPSRLLGTHIPGPPAPPSHL